MKSGRTGHGENLLQCTVIFNEGKPNEYKDTIKVKSLGNSMWSGPYVYTGSEFKNLPERQFVGWATRKLNQISDEVANSTTSATDTEDEEEVNVDDIVTAEEEKLGEAFDGPIKWTEAPYVEKDVPQDNYNLDSPEESMLLGAMDKTMNAIRDMEKWDNKGAVKNLNGADSKIVTVKNRLTKRINTGVGNGPVKEKKGLFGKKKINDSLKESAQPENYAIVRNGEITDTYNNLGEAKSMLYTIYDQIDAGVTLGRKRDYYIKAYDEDKDEVYGPIIESLKESDENLPDRVMYKIYEIEDTTDEYDCDWEDAIAIKLENDYGCEPMGFDYYEESGSAVITDIRWVDDNDYENESLTEDTVKQGSSWVNKGDTGETHGKFKTKKEADAQRRAMFAQGYKAEDCSSKECDEIDSSKETLTEEDADEEAYKKLKDGQSFKDALK